MEGFVSPIGALSKLESALQPNGDVLYHLPIGEQRLPLNDLIGKDIKLVHHEVITCRHCHKKTKKSYSQGFCFPCMQKLAQCDLCIMKPETCHYAAGTCREPKWGETHCMTPHYVYLANSSGIKVGITRHTQIPTRWIDQGAAQALPIMKVKSRIISGLVEVAISKFIADKTNWRAMLRGAPESVNLEEKANILIAEITKTIEDIKLSYGDDAIEILSENPVDITFPVVEYPIKISSLNFDKTPEISGRLQGIKGQYLILDTGVLNMRKFGSYHIHIEY